MSYPRASCDAGCLPSVLSSGVDDAGNNDRFRQHSKKIMKAQVSVSLIRLCVRMPS